jgi:uncharacterized sporulation protein YeaH/YhbH (DUF444 family)
MFRLRQGEPAGTNAVDLDQRFAEQLHELDQLRGQFERAGAHERVEAGRRLDHALGRAIDLAAAGEVQHVDLASGLPVTRKVRAALDTSRKWGHALTGLLDERERLRFEMSDIPRAPRPARMSTTDSPIAH